MASVHSCWSWTAQVADVFQLVVQHNRDANEPQTICSLLQVSTAVRWVLQQTRGRCCIHTTHLGGDWPQPPDIARVVGFAAWLLRHSGLVCSINLHIHEDPGHVSSLALTAALSMCCKLEALDFRHAVTATMAPAAAAVRAAAAAAAAAAGPVPGAAFTPNALSAVAAAGGGLGATGAAAGGISGAAPTSATPPVAATQAAAPTATAAGGATGPMTTSARLAATAAAAGGGAASPPPTSAPPAAAAAAAATAGGAAGAAAMSARSPASKAARPTPAPAPAPLPGPLVTTDALLTASAELIRSYLFPTQGSHDAHQVVQAAVATSAALDLAAPWPLPLRLGTFMGDQFLANQDVLLALRQAGVTELHLSCNPSQATPGFTQALAGLPALQDLWLNAPLEDCALPSSVAAALGQLPKLELLDTALEPASVRLLPPQVTYLSIYLWPGEDGGTHADFSHMTQLDTFKYSSPDDSHFSVKLPSHLEAIQLFGPITKLSGHGRLTYVEYHPGLPNHLALLRDLVDLPHEWYLHLNLECDTAVLPGFEQQQQQQQGQVEEAEGYQEALQARVRELRQGAEYLGSCRMLTGLDLGLAFGQQCRELVGKVDWCQQVAKLTQLWKLKLTMEKPDLDDLTHLTALKSLHSLELNSIPSESPCEVVSSVFAKMPSLQNLNLRCDAFTSLQQLSAISNLTRLTKLQLKYWHSGAVMCDADCGLLTSLRKLCDLTLPLVQQCSDEARLQFQAQMPQLTCLVHWQL